jgi:hypothetical protein
MGLYATLPQQTLQIFATLGYSRINPNGGSLISIGGSILEELSLTGIAHLAIALHLGRSIPFNIKYDTRIASCRLPRS